MKGLYMYPCDEQEKDRMDIFHRLFAVARDEELHRVPIRRDVPVKILDLGTGTGIWAIEVADRYHNAWVDGMDIANIQPERIPENLSFKIPQDFESPWLLGEETYDMIHLRSGCGSVSSWPHMYRKVFNHLKPGHGWFEGVEIDLTPRCDDETLKEHAAVRHWWYEMSKATQRVNKPLAYNPGTKDLLLDAGFTDVSEFIIRAPFNSWPQDPVQKDIGRWYNLGMTDSGGLESLSLGPLTRVAGWSVDQVKGVVREVQKEMKNKKIHAYNEIHVYYGRRPRAPHDPNP
ncbi:MAG: hypothetical protein M1832_005243 [Thelocarpon impressellum]|nr:MAG: hypothetical protein M1832_005243 [Thelocarpon impressellum]